METPGTLKESLKKNCLHADLIFLGRFSEGF